MQDKTRLRPPGKPRANPGHRAAKTAGTITRSAAEELGLKALLFLAEDEGRLIRFLAETGLDPEGLKSQAGTPATLAAVLGHLLDDESLLLVFTAGAGIDPVDLQSAFLALGGVPTWDSV